MVRGIAFRIIRVKVSNLKKKQIFLKIIKQQQNYRKKKNQKLQIIEICFIIIYRSDFIHKLAISVITNNNPAIRNIDLSYNLIEDKGK